MSLLVNQGRPLLKHKTTTFHPRDESILVGYGLWDDFTIIIRSLGQTHMNLLAKLTHTSSLLTSNKNISKFIFEIRIHNNEIRIWDTTNDTSTRMTTILYLNHSVNELRTGFKYILKRKIKANHIKFLLRGILNNTCKESGTHTQTLGALTSLLDRFTTGITHTNAVREGLPLSKITTPTTTHV